MKLLPYERIKEYVAINAVLEKCESGTWYFSCLGYAANARTIERTYKLISLKIMCNVKAHQYVSMAIAG